MYDIHNFYMKFVLNVFINIAIGFLLLSTANYRLLENGRNMSFFLLHEMSTNN